MEAKLKEGEFRIGAGRTFFPRKTGIVIVVDKEDHPIFGERFKIEGCDEWYEKNCFEWIEEKENG